jgi:GNAT superfamily N-acetyltransferase
MEHGSSGTPRFCHPIRPGKAILPGPCVLVEYRNRGFGTGLLKHSLQALREAGVTRAVAVSKENAPVAKFLYPKFNGVLTPGDHTPLLAA